MYCSFPKVVPFPCDCDCGFNVTCGTVAPVVMTCASNLMSNVMTELGPLAKSFQLFAVAIYRSLLHIENGVSRVH